MVPTLYNLLRVVSYIGANRPIRAGQSRLLASNQTDDDIGIKLKLLPELPYKALHMYICMQTDNKWETVQKLIIMAAYYQHKFRFRRYGLLKGR